MIDVDKVNAARSELHEWAKRYKGGETLDRRLDVEIWRALGYEVTPWRGAWRWRPAGTRHWEPVPFLTSSLDAAFKIYPRPHPTRIPATPLGVLIEALGQLAAGENTLDAIASRRKAEADLPAPGNVFSHVNSIVVIKSARRAPRRIKP